MSYEIHQARVLAHKGEHVVIHGRPQSGRTTLAMACVDQLCDPSSVLLCAVSSFATQEEWETQSSLVYMLSNTTQADALVERMRRFRNQRADQSVVLVLDDVRTVLLDTVRDALPVATSSVTVTQKHEPDDDSCPPLGGDTQWLDARTDAWSDELNAAARQLPPFVFIDPTFRCYAKVELKSSFSPARLQRTYCHLGSHTN